MSAFFTTNPFGSKEPCQRALWPSRSKTAAPSKNTVLLLLFSRLGVAEKVAEQICSVLLTDSAQQASPRTAAGVLVAPPKIANLSQRTLESPGKQVRGIHCASTSLPLALAVPCETGLTPKTAISETTSRTCLKASREATLLMVECGKKKSKWAGGGFPQFVHVHCTRCRPAKAHRPSAKHVPTQEKDR